MKISNHIYNNVIFWEKFAFLRYSLFFCHHYTIFITQTFTRWNSKLSLLNLWCFFVIKVFTIATAISSTCKVFHLYSLICNKLSRCNYSPRNFFACNFILTPRSTRVAVRGLEVYFKNHPENLKICLTIIFIIYFQVAAHRSAIPALGATVSVPRGP